MGAITAVHILGGLVQLTLSARILGPEGFGVLAAVIAVTALIHGLLAVPGGEAVTTFVTRAVAADRPQEASRILRFTMAASLGLSLVAYAVVAVLALMASSLLGIEDAYRDLALIYGVILLATRTESLAVLRLSDRVSLGLAITLAGVLTRVALFGAVWLKGGGLLEVVLAHIAGVVVSGAGMLVAAAVSAPRAGITGFLSSLSLKVPPDVVRFQTGVFGRSTFAALAYNVDTLLVAQFAGSADVGLYRAARQITETAHYPFQPLKDGVQLQYSRQWYSGLGGALRRTSLLFGLVSVRVGGSAVRAACHLPSTHRLALPGRGVLRRRPPPAGHDFRRLRRQQHFRACRAADGGRARLAVVGGGDGRFGGFRRRPRMAGSAARRGGRCLANTTYYGVIALILVPSIISTLRQSRRLRQKP